MQYQTTDLYCAGYLLANGVHIAKVDRSQARVVFHFDGVPPDLIRAWFSGQALVDARGYAAAIRQCKALLFEEAGR